MKDYNKEYYSVAFKALQDMKYYSGDIINDCADYLLHYFPEADKGELLHTVNWALADAWNGGCEVETL